MKVSIIGGGGRVGACAAYALECQGLVSDIQIIDANADAAEQAGVSVQRLQLDGMPHGFGAEGGWINSYDLWLTELFSGS